MIANSRRRNSALNRQKMKEHIPITNFEDYQLKKEFKHGNPVYLNVYHLSIINYILQIFGFGLFHTTVEIKDLEYSFGSTNEEVAGIFTNKTGILEKHLRLKEKIYLGNSLYNNYSIYKLLSLQYPYWLGSTYDPFVKNCNHFSKFFAGLLLNHKISYPDYINRLSKYGMMFTSFYPPIKRLYSDMVLKVTNSNLKIIQNTSERFKDQEVGNSSKDGVNLLKRLSKSKNEVNESSKETEKDIKRTNSEEIALQNGHYELIMNDLFTINPFLKNISFADSIQSQKEDDSSVALINKVINDIKEIEHENHLENQEKLIENILNDKNIEQLSIELKIEMEDECLQKFHSNNILPLYLYHKLFYINYNLKNTKKQETISNNILKLEPNDYYAMLYLAYLRFIQNRFPECEELIRNASSTCKGDVQFKNNIKQFEDLLNNL